MPFCLHFAYPAAFNTNPQVAGLLNDIDSFDNQQLPDIGTGLQENVAYYRISTDAADLAAFTADVGRLCAGSVGTFTPLYVVVFTLYKVRTYSAPRLSDPYLTYQMRIATDGVSSYAFYAYDAVQVTDSNQGLVGFGSGTATAPFRFLSDNNKAGLLALPSGTNMGVIGLYGFRIDESSGPRSGACSNSPTPSATSSSTASATATPSPTATATATR